MRKWVSKFVSSKLSGYLLLGILAALAAGGYWFWSELKEFGSLEAKAESQAHTIAGQRAQLNELARLGEQRQTALSKQIENVERLKRATRMQQLAVMEAKKHADKVTRECMSLHLADSLQFGPSRQNGSGEDKARSDVDG